MAADSSERPSQQTQIMRLNVLESTKLDGNFPVNKTDRENVEYTIEAITDCKKDEVRLYILLAYSRHQPKKAS